MIRVLLSEKGRVTPYQWWWKFLHDTDDRNAPHTAEERVDIINTELLNWSAQLWDHRQQGASYAFTNAYIDFYDEKAYAWFLLRWA